MNDSADAITALAPEKLETTDRVWARRPVDTPTGRVAFRASEHARYVGMGYGLYETSQVFRAEIDRCSSHPRALPWNRHPERHIPEQRHMEGGGQKGKELTLGG